MGATRPGGEVPSAVTAASRAIYAHCGPKAEPNRFVVLTLVHRESPDRINTRYQGRPIRLIRHFTSCIFGHPRGDGGQTTPYKRFRRILRRGVNRARTPRDTAHTDQIHSPQPSTGTKAILWGTPYGARPVGLCCLEIRRCWARDDRGTGTGRSFT